MFQFPRFASLTYGFSHGILACASGFPHSDISGSKSGCRLPEAFRRLQRPSSPPAAKASTVCAYSLDHIPKQPSRCTAANTLQSVLRSDLPPQHLYAGYALDSQFMCVPHTFTTSITEASTPAIALSHFHLVKEPSGCKTQTAATGRTAARRSSLDSFLPSTPENRNPAANGVRASRSSLPTHTHHLRRRLVELSGIEPLTSCVQGRRSPS